MKVDQLNEYNKRKFFLKKNHAENDEERVVLDLFLRFKKAFYEIIGSGLQLCFKIH